MLMKTQRKKMPDKERNEVMRSLSQVGQIGFTLTVCVLAGVFIGRFLDGVFGTTPWLLLVFSFIGAGAAFKSLIDMAKRL